MQYDFEGSSIILFAGYADDDTPQTYLSNMQTELNNPKDVGNCHLLNASESAVDIQISDASVQNEKTV